MTNKHKRIFGGGDIAIYSRTALRACIIPFEYGGRDCHYDNLWIQFPFGVETLAVGAVYALQDSHIDRRNHNEQLYSQLFVRYKECQKFNYKVILGGDFNSHISNDFQGIPGNFTEINANRQLFHNFWETSQLLLVNIASCAKRLWTHVQPTKSLQLTT